MFIGRKEELNFLEKRYKNNNKEFGVIYGRRRIGKSTLITEFLKNKPNLFFQAKKDSLYGNLKSFSYEVNKLLNQNKSFVYDDFQEAVDAVIEYAKDKRFVIAIDEYPYIVKQNPSFPSIMQEIIDKAHDNLFFILSGSDISMLKNEIIDHNSPLYKRRTFEMEIKKLKYNESIEYLKGLENEEKLKFLSIASTYPYYLSAMNYEASFDENLKELIFNEYGAFFSLPDQLLSNSTNTQDIYNAILYAVSKRKKSNKEIAQYIHEDEAKVSKYISTLVSSELLDRRETYLGTKKTIYYEIGDPLLRFWYLFVYDNQEKIKINGQIVLNNLKEEINKFISYGFEDVSRMYMDYLNHKGLLGDVYNSFKPYKADKSILGRSVEIDGLSDNNKKLIVMECKFRTTKFSSQMLQHLIESSSIFPSKLEKEYYLFSKSGFTEEIFKLNNSKVHLITVDDMFNI